VCKVQTTRSAEKEEPSRRRLQLPQIPGQTLAYLFVPRHTTIGQPFEVADGFGICAPITGAEIQQELFDGTT